MTSSIHRVRRALLLAGAAALAIAATTGRAEAQVGAGARAQVGAQAPYPSAAGYRAAAARDDVRWEERRVPYDGGPIRPGGQLEGSISGFVWLGVAGFAGGFALSSIGAFNGRSYALIPIVGPWLALGNVGQDRLSWEAGPTAAMVISGLFQPAGIGFFIAGILAPNLSVVYDAPVGRPSPFETARVRITPYAPGADVGVGLAVETF